MSPYRTPVKLQTILAALVTAIFVVLPFHAFFSVWLSSFFGHYILFRLWKEFILVVLLVGVFYFLLTDQKLRLRLFGSLLARLMVLYLLFLILKTASGLLSSEVSIKAAGYGLIVDSRLILFFLVCLVLAAKTDLSKLNIHKWILAPAVVVSVFALLQYFVLPYNFLSHFGYGTNTILPYQTINHDTNYIRAISTLRGANPLGAYLVMIISMTLPLLVFAKRKIQKQYLAIGLVLYGAALVVSFSRSAWIGVVISVITILLVGIRNQQKMKILFLGFAVVAAVGFAGSYILRNNTTLDNAIFHTNDNSTIQRSSNEDHASALAAAIKDVVYHPFGEGVGSAGPASAYNSQTKIAENYYLQLAQETGWLGLLLFMLVYAGIGLQLWRQKANPTSLGLFGALVGLSFVALLSHNWTDDTLAYLFFGLSGIVLSPAILKLKQVKTNAPQHY